MKVRDIMVRFVCTEMVAVVRETAGTEKQDKGGGCWVEGKDMHRCQ
jgi:hypothetical protein